MVKKQGVEGLQKPRVSQVPQKAEEAAREPKEASRPAESM